MSTLSYTDISLFGVTKFVRMIAFIYTLAEFRAMSGRPKSGVFPHVRKCTFPHEFAVMLLIT